MVWVVLWGMVVAAWAGPREKQWGEVVEALDGWRAATAVKLLRSLEKAAFADGAAAEGGLALLLRVRLENGLGPENGEDLALFAGAGQAGRRGEAAERARDPFADVPVEAGAEGFEGGWPGAVRQLERELAKAPVEVRPVLRWHQGDWLWRYAEEKSYDWSKRSDTGDSANEPIEEWGPARMRREIDKCFAHALAGKEQLKRMPVANLQGLLGPAGSLGDVLRPTVYDVLAHYLVRYWRDNTYLHSDLRAPLSIAAGTPAFASLDEFLAWQPADQSDASDDLRALRIYQELLAMHRHDADPTALLHCDLERLRWAGRLASTQEASREYVAAIRRFIAAHADHPLSADARQDDVMFHIAANENRAAHASALAGAEAFPEHPFGKMCRMLVDRLEAPALIVESATSWAPAGDSVHINQTNVKHVWLRLYRMDWRVEMEWDQDRRIASKEAMEGLMFSAPEYAWDFAIEAAEDFQQHTVEVESPANLRPGYYLLVASSREDFSVNDGLLAWTGVQVTPYNLIVAQAAGGEPRALVVDAVTGGPVAGVRVEFWRREPAPRDAQGKSLHHIPFAFAP